MGYDYRTATSSPVGSVAPMSRTGYDVVDTVVAYTLADRSVEGDPRRPVLRPGLVDRGEHRPRVEHQLVPDRPVDERHYDTAAAYLARYGPEVRSDRAGRLDRLPPPELHVERLRDLLAPALRRRRHIDRAQVRPRQRLRPPRGGDLGARLRRDATRAVERDPGEVHHRLDRAQRRDPGAATDRREPGFTVAWSGTDDVGIAAYDVRPRSTAASGGRG
jgi:hypothetical protein